jgi:hypothetical protein
MPVKLNCRSNFKFTLNRVDRQVTTQLGVELHPVRATLVDMARSLLQHGVAAPEWHKAGAAVHAA